MRWGIFFLMLLGILESRPRRLVDPIRQTGQLLATVQGLPVGFASLGPQGGSLLDGLALVAPRLQARIKESSALPEQG